MKATEKVGFGYGQELVVAHLDMAVMTGALRSYSIPVPSTPTQAARALVEHFTKLKPKKLADCDRCGGISDELLDVCPFCGDRDEDLEDRAVPATLAGAPPKGLVELKALVELNRKDPGKKAALVPLKALPVVTVVVGREKDLDAAVARVRKLQVAGIVCQWQLGREIKAIHESELWMARSAEGKGKKGQRYKAFDQFVRAELAMTAANAFSLAKVAAEFSEEQVREIGPSKLALVLQAPKEARKALIKKAKTKKRAELRDEVKKVNKEAGRGRERKPKVTAVQLDERVVIDLFCRPAKGQEPRRAKKLDDEPWGTHELANGVKQVFRVKMSPKGLQVVVVSKRIEE